MHGLLNWCCAYVVKLMKMFSQFTCVLSTCICCCNLLVFCLFVLVVLICLCFVYLHLLSQCEVHLALLSHRRNRPYLFNLFLQVPDSGFPAVLPNEQTQCIRWDWGLLLSQATQRAELRNKIALDRQRNENQKHDVLVMRTDFFLLQFDNGEKTPVIKNIQLQSY